VGIEADGRHRNSLAYQRSLIGIQKEIAQISPGQQINGVAMNVRQDQAKEIFEWPISAIKSWCTPQISKTQLKRGHGSSLLILSRMGPRTPIDNTNMPKST
jgi:hypothetical protein